MTTAAKYVAMSYLFTFFVVMSTYGANLMASLTTQQPDIPIKTVEDLAAFDSMTILVRPQTSHRTILKVSEIYLAADIWQAMPLN